MGDPPGACVEVGPAVECGAKMNLRPRWAGQNRPLARIMHEEPILGETQEPPCGTNVVFITF